jgi:hypothetical protein
MLFMTSHRRGVIEFSPSEKGGGCRALLEVTGTQRIPNCRAGGAWVGGSCPHIPLDAPLRPFQRPRAFIAASTYAHAILVDCFPCAMPVLIYVITQLPPLGGGVPCLSKYCPKFWGVFRHPDVGSKVLKSVPFLV